MRILGSNRDKLKRKKMFERLKTALVDSFVGAIAIGLLLSQGISQIVRVAFNPITVWLQQRQYSENYPVGAARAAWLESMLPQLLMSAILLLIAYGLLRWLYFPSEERKDQDVASEPQQSA
jgi:nitric oxide reductase large subunit